MEKITVLTADIVDSRRNLQQKEKLKEKLKNYTRDFIISSFSMSRGDEIQAIIKGWLQHPNTIRNLRYLAYPLKLRIGIGIGYLEEYVINKPLKDPWSMEGTAFYSARNAVENLKEIKTTMTLFNCSNSYVNKYINTILMLMDTIQDRWTKEQWEAIHKYEELGTYSEAAKILNISYQNVEKRCKAANWKQFYLAEETLAEFDKVFSSFHLIDGE
ncbi:SatD family protein [Desulfitibacter alkalitolerans]|uniref:SatD family protein n=1 Tax=Desulfitibacter alkalitolerans TaxID=264641 RepID=UPI0006849EA8|nr:SatD family protein [Desulfitibacter alkalitolerans]